MTRSWRLKDGGQRLEKSVVRSVREGEISEKELYSALFGEDETMTPQLLKTGIRLARRDNM